MCFLSTHQSGEGIGNYELTTENESRQVKHSPVRK